MAYIPHTRSSSTTALTGIWNLTLTAFILGALYFGRDILIPIALAALLTFLMAPLVTRLQRFLGRIMAVTLSVVLAFGAVIFISWIVTMQLVDLGAQLPQYKDNIQSKIQAATQIQSKGWIAKTTQWIEDFKISPPGAAKNEPTKRKADVPAQDAQQPLPVRVVQAPKATPLEIVKLVAAPILGPLGTAGLVFLLVIFMLLQRENLRGRIIRLIGQGRISATTRLMEDASKRVSRYLLMQLVVNVTYGFAIAIGLHFIGVPNAPLWGAIATILRFIPYAGPWIAAAFPIILSLAISADWWMPAKAVALFLGLELLSNNVMEPWLYGSSTGVSSLALIIAAVFWTWLWGPVGLVLATPMTVCLVVMGRHIPKLSFLAVMLSDEDALTPAEDCYHRLLRTGAHEEMDLLVHHLKTHSVSDVYDSVLVPVIVASETDLRIGLLDKEQLETVQRGMREILEDLEHHLPPLPQLDSETTTHTVESAPLTITCVPARAERDALAGEMLTQMLRRQGFLAQSASSKPSTAERVITVTDAPPDILFVSAVEPTSLSQIRYLCRKLKDARPEQIIFVGLWTSTNGSSDEKYDLLNEGADLVVTTFAEAENAVIKFSKVRTL